MTAPTKRVQQRGGRYAPTEDGPGHRAAARALFEATPGMTIDRIAGEIGVKSATIRQWKHRDAAAGAPWRPAAIRLPMLGGLAGELANRFEMRMSELGRPLDDEAAAREVALQVANEHAISVRAQVIDRHRREWAGPRKLVYEAARTGDLDRARLGKMMAEALDLVQRGERRSFGLDDAACSADAQGVLVVVDRGDTKA